MNDPTNTFSDLESIKKAVTYLLANYYFLAHKIIFYEIIGISTQWLKHLFLLL